MILKRKFYERDSLSVAKDLLGKFFVHATKEGTVIGKIVEVEAYLGPEDRASHAYNNHRSERTEIQFGSKGHAYIYQIYGMYFCFDVTSGKSVGKPEAILVRALEPVKGIELMIKRRNIKKGQIKNLTNGPGKLCAAMGITKRQNGVDLCRPPLWIESGVQIGENQIYQTTRINIDYAGECKHLPWRFFIKGNDFVSVKSNV